MNKISIFRAPIKNTVPSVNVSLADVFKVLRSGKYKNVTAELRSKTNKAGRDLWKQNKLDYATFSGTFTKRANTFKTGTAPNIKYNKRVTEKGEYKQKTGLWFKNVHKAFE